MKEMKIVVVNLNPCVDWQYTVQKYVHGGLNRVSRTRTDIAGKGINVAFALKNLGLDPLVTGFNFEENGFLLTQKLDMAGIRHDFVEIPGEIRVNIKMYEEETGQMTELNQPGAFVPPEARNQLLEKIARHQDIDPPVEACNANSHRPTDLCRNTDPPIEVCQANSNHPPKRGDCDTNIAERFNWCRNILVVSGSRPQGVAADFYAKICKLHPGKIFLDTEGEALKIALETAPPFAIKPNLFELESLFQKKDLSDIKVKNFSSPEEIAEICRKKIIPYGVKIVCVSMGAEGAVLVAGDSAENSFFLPALNLPVKGVAGAGDAMVAGMVYSMAYEITAPERLLSSGMAAAAASVVLDGTEMCTADGFINFGKKLATPRSCRF